MAVWDGSYAAAILLRTTAAYVTNPTNCGHLPSDEDGNDLPGAQTVTLTNGDTIAAGWAATGGTPSGSQQTGAGTRDRDNTLDARIAGIHFVNANVQKDLVVTLPSTGDYLVWAAFGDTGAGDSGCILEILDGSTSKATYNVGAMAAGSSRDLTMMLNLATQVARTIDSGIGRAVRVNFASTTCRFRLGGTSSAPLSALAYVRLQKYTPATFEPKNQAGTVVATAAQTWTVNIPKDVVDGDLLIFQFTTNASAVSTPANFPAGVTQIGSDQAMAASDGTMIVCSKVAASEGATLTFTNMWTANASGICTVYSIRGQHASNPINQNAQSGPAAATTTSGPAVTTTIDGCIILQLLGTDPSTSAYQGTANASPAFAVLNDGKDPGSLAYNFAQWYLQPTQGTITPGVTGLTSDNYAIFTIAIAPASATGAVLAVTAAQGAFEAQNVNLIATDAQVVAVVPGQLAVESQEIPFVYTLPGSEGSMAGEGADIQMLAQAVIGVTEGQGCGEGQQVAQVFAQSIVVDTAGAAMNESTIGLLATGIIQNNDGGIPNYRRRRRRH